MALAWPQYMQLADGASSIVPEFFVKHSPQVLNCQLLLCLWQMIQLQLQQ
jgi:hypothetical protein